MEWQEAEQMINNIAIRMQNALAANRGVRLSSDELFALSLTSYIPTPSDIEEGES
jgi:hypothetical protein